ncbi:hypothetical protein [Streptomyces tubercidicus]|uniref:hypothetical protein n=1 Tax=Streptomyces tubercidicus TaxID=47759 RepID=UPI0034675C29
MTRWKRPAARQLRAHAPAPALWLLVCGPPTLAPFSSVDGTELWVSLAALPLLGVGVLLRRRRPLVALALPESFDHPQPTAAARELAHARQRVQRRLRQMVTVPLTLLAALTVLSGVFHLVSPSWTVLERDHYTALRLGTERSRLAPLLPFLALDAPPDGTPPPPHGWTCEYYSIRAGSDSAYALCFTDDDRLAGKSVVHRRDR